MKFPCVCAFEFLQKKRQKKRRRDKKQKKTETCNVINFVDRLSTLKSGKNKKRT